MNTSKKIFIAFVLNLSFSVFEFFSGLFSGSVAILSDAVHDMGDATSIGLSYFLEKKSKRQPDRNYTYGYMRYSILGSLITSLVLVLGSVFVISGAVTRIINPVKINYDSMIIFAIIGVVVNFCAAYFTHGGDSLNQRAVNLHMIEDVLGWIVVLVGAIVMRFTDFALIDPIMSICVALFILYNAAKNLKEVVDMFLLKTPKSVSVEKVEECVSKISGVSDVHHIHLLSLGDSLVYATMHIVTDEDASKIKEEVKHHLKHIGVVHVTVEVENSLEICDDYNCFVKFGAKACHHHH